MSHTKGPWEVDMRRPITIHAQDGSQIADCGQFLNHKRSEEGLEANAHLIAAAPDMYEEETANLQMMENLAADLHAGRVLHRAAIEEGLRVRIAKTRAALKRARGER